jgi:hypothetical protein
MWKREATFERRFIVKVASGMKRYLRSFARTLIDYASSVGSPDDAPIAGGVEAVYRCSTTPQSNAAPRFAKRPAP